MVLHRRLVLLMLLLFLRLVSRSRAAAVASVEWEGMHAAADDCARTLEAHLLILIVVMGTARAAVTPVVGPAAGSASL